MRCSTCGHLRDYHEHHHRGSYCAACTCVRFLHPLVGWLRHLTDQAADLWARRG